MIENRSVGAVTGVHGFRIKVELDPEWKSPVRATIDGAETVVAINSYLTFAIGGGETAIGIITDLEARESFDPAMTDDLTLELVRPKRTATIQLLGTIRRHGPGFSFDPGITVLPTLDTRANPATKDVLRTVFFEAPRRNRPSAFDGEDFDSGLEVGIPAGVPGEKLLASFNDLFSRPLAVVGNTGSGKSCTIAHLVQKALEDRQSHRPRFFILDINGEYGRAFRKEEARREPNVIYLDGVTFSVPLWLMNASEVCQWLSAAEQVQEPVLKNLWSLAKGKTGEPSPLAAPAKDALLRLDQIIDILRTKGWDKAKKIGELWAACSSFLSLLPDDQEKADLSRNITFIIKSSEGASASLGNKEVKLMEHIATLQTYIALVLKKRDELEQESADKPVYFQSRALHDPTILMSAAKVDQGELGLQQNLRGLELRLRNRLNDKRWRCFLNWDQIGITSAQVWLERLGIGRHNAADVCVIDCSMLSYEVLPYATGVIGRTILELREHVDAEARFHDPWVLVLEEAHNYVRPRRQTEDRGISVSREAFERIAKEGRKFGLSLIVASQRPSEISPTVLSQCANFIMHRLQNPEDIEHFRSIVPSQSRRLLDQVTILGPGEAIVVGSAFHVPSRAKVQKPDPEPFSQSSVPHMAWRPQAPEHFALDSALRNWGIPASVVEQE